LPAMFANRSVRGVLIPSVAFYVVAVLAIIAYGHILRSSGSKDFLAKQFRRDLDFDGWSVSHFLFFGFLGLMYPNRHLQFFTVGVGWELVETGLGQNAVKLSGKRLQLIGEQDGDGFHTGDQDAYWYGKVSDIVANMAGYCLGSAAAEKWWPNRREAHLSAALARQADCRSPPRRKDTSYPPRMELRSHSPASTR
jgi:hypothetical protein